MKTSEIARRSEIDANNPAHRNQRSVSYNAIVSAATLSQVKYSSTRFLPFFPYFLAKSGFVTIFSACSAMFYGLFGSQ